MKFIFFILTLCCASSCFGTDSLLWKSSYWPNRVQLQSNFELEGSSLKPGTSGILIRVDQKSTEETAEAVVDFGRHGIFSVPVEMTDLRESTKLIESGDLPKEFSNYALMLGNKLIGVAGEFQTVQKLSAADLQERGGLLFLYLPNKEVASRLISRLKFTESSQTQKIPTIVCFQMDGSVKRTFMETLSAKTGMAVATFPEYLIKPFIRSLHHLEASGPETKLVFTDLDGKIFDVADNLEEIIGWFSLLPAQN